MRPGLYGESHGRAQDAGNQNGRNHRPGGPEVRLLQKRCSYRHERGGDSYLQHRDLLEREALGGAPQKDDLEGKANRASDRQEVTQVDPGEIGQPLASSGDRHQIEPHQREHDSHYTPPMNMRAPEQHHHQRHHHRGGAGKKGRL